jgi:hypothetical protein
MSRRDHATSTLGRVESPSTPVRRQAVQDRIKVVVNDLDIDRFRSTGKISESPSAVRPGRPGRGAAG